MKQIIKLHYDGYDNYTRPTKIEVLIGLSSIRRIDRTKAGGGSIITFNDLKTMVVAESLEEIEALINEKEEKE